MKNARWLLGVLVLLAAAFWVLRGVPDPQREGASRPPAPVTAVTAALMNFRDQTSALGTLRAWESVDIRASVSQIITALYFDDGQEVARGDVLALLKQDAEQATLRELQASLEDARREVSRLLNLARQNQVAQTDLDKARTREQVTLHQIEAIQASIADRTVLAPFSGVLGLREVSLGALVTPGQRMTTLDDITRMRLDFTLPARQLDFVRTGQTVSARTPAFDREFSGIVTALDTRIDPVTRAVRVRAAFDNPGRILRPGLLMEVTLYGPERQALLVPEESLQSRADQHFVWKLGEGVAVRTRVTIGSRSPGWVEISGGLAAGDELVRDGLGRLGGETVPVRRVER